MSWTPARYKFRDEAAAKEAWLPFDDIYEHVGGSLQSYPIKGVSGQRIQLRSVKTGQNVGWVFLPLLTPIQDITHE